MDQPQTPLQPPPAKQILKFSDELQNIFDNERFGTSSFNKLDAVWQEVGKDDTGSLPLSLTSVSLQGAVPTATDGELLSSLENLMNTLE